AGPPDQYGRARKMLKYDLSNPRILHIFHADGHPAVGFIFKIFFIIGGNKPDIFDSHLPDTTRPRIFGDGSAAIGTVQRRSDRGIDGNGVTLNLGNSSVPYKIAFAGFPSYPIYF